MRLADLLLDCAFMKRQTAFHSLTIVSSDNTSSKAQEVCTHMLRSKRHQRVLGQAEHCILSAALVFKVKTKAFNLKTQLSDPQKLTVTTSKRRENCRMNRAGANTSYCFEVWHPQRAKTMTITEFRATFMATRGAEGMRTSWPGLWTS